MAKLHTYSFLSIGACVGSRDSRASCRNTAPGARPTGEEEPSVLRRQGDTGLADRDPYQGTEVPTPRARVPGTGAHCLDGRGARQLEGDGASLAAFSSVPAAVHRRANATVGPAATAGSAQGRRQEGIKRPP